MPATSTTRVVEAIVEAVERKDWISFVEVRRILEDQEIAVRGDLAIEFTPNTFLWLGMSDEFVEIIRALQADGRVTIASTSVFLYFIDGSVPSLPVAKRLTEKGYFEPRWLPVCFRPVRRATQ